MDTKYFGAMLLRGIGQAELPITNIEWGNEDNSILYLSTETKEKFLVRIEQVRGKSDISFENLKSTTIKDIYETFTRTSECNEMLMKNEFDLSELKEKLNYEEYYQLETRILDYSSKNDEILFEAGFRYAWSLFCECMRAEIQK